MTSARNLPQRCSFINLAPDVWFFPRQFVLVRIIFPPFGLPSFTPSAFFLASASLVRWLIRLRSISADRPKAKARTLHLISTSIPPPLSGRGGMIVLRIRKSILPFSSRKQFQAPLVHRLHLYAVAVLTDFFAIVVGE